MTRNTARMARLERAVIAGIASYVLLLQVMLGAVGSGAALGHALDGRFMICNGGPVAVPPPDPAGRPVVRDLCCVVPALAAAAAPVVPAVVRTVAVLRETLAAAIPARSGAPAAPPTRARAPPIAT